MQISRLPLETEARLQRTTNRKWHMVNQMVTWLKFKMAHSRRFALSESLSAFLVRQFIHCTDRILYTDHFLNSTTVTT